jgi:hypothetical protein
MGMFTDLHKLDLEQQAEAPAKTAKQSRRTQRATPPPDDTPLGATAGGTPSSQGLPAAGSAAPDRTKPAPEAAAPAMAEPASPPRADLTTEPLRPAADLSEVPYRKATFLLTDEEFEALDELKLGVRRALDLKVTKEDLARCAIGYMVHDFRRRKAESAVFAPLRQRRGR